MELEIELAAYKKNYTKEELLKQTENGKFFAVESDAKFPPYVPTHKGKCERCAREAGDVATMRVDSKKYLDPDGEEFEVCADCFHDCLAGATIIPCLISIEGIAFIPVKKADYIKAKAKAKIKPGQ